MRKGYAQREYTKRIKIPNAEYCPLCGLLMETVWEYNPFPMKTRKCNHCDNLSTPLKEK